MNTSNVIWCQYCKKDVLPYVKMYDTKVCPFCNRILDSAIGINKGK